MTTHRRQRIRMARWRWLTRFWEQRNAWLYFARRTVMGEGGQ